MANQNIIVANQTKSLIFNSAVAARSITITITINFVPSPPARI
jgi:hypothetical protein